METMDKVAPAATVDEYIKRCPAQMQPALQKLRKTIRAAAREADEVISYNIPGYMYHGMLVFFAAFKNHISVYPAPRTHPAFKKELTGFKGGKGTVQFPIDKPIPFELVTRIVKHRKQENEEKAALKKKAKAKVTGTKSKTTKPTDEEQVATYMMKLDEPIKTMVEALRKIIKGTDKKLSERIKWNAPSYYYKEDIVTFGPYRNGKVLLVFHHPSVVKVRSAILEGNYKDRRLVYFDNDKTIKASKKELQRIISEIIKTIDKK